MANRYPNHRHHRGPHDLQRSDSAGFGLCRQKPDPENQFDLEIDFLVGKKQLGKIIDRCIRIHGTAKTSEVLDRIKAQGFKYSTKSGYYRRCLRCGDSACRKTELIAAGGCRRLLKITRQYDRGLISDDERYDRVIKIWNETTNKVTDALTENLRRVQPHLHDGRLRSPWLHEPDPSAGRYARTDCKYLPVPPSKFPIKSNYREGLNILEYFISSRGARKGLADTALRTADSGYLTRRLVDVSQDVIIRQERLRHPRGHRGP